ncbi:MAG TPA: SRPBCC family protein [Chloroflexota bacterium]|nr:SRPBCC family protein [Chloroflexota bacterium]
MPEVVNTAVIQAPAARVFDFIAQAERNAEWVPDLQRSERLTDGPTRVGTRFRFSSRIAGIPIDVTDEVTAFEPHRLIAFAGVSGPPHAGSWVFEPIEDGAGQPATRVTYRMAFDLPPGIGPFVAKMLDIPRRLDEQSLACLRNLRRFLET